jgi:glycosyltransferase involved in cell wall biosynthesis
MDAPVKLVVIKVRNRSGRTRRLSVTCYWELVLGQWRHSNLMHVVTEIDPNTGALFARNVYNREFAGKTVFVNVSDTARTLTGNRTEFLGRNGTPANPAALRQTQLSGQTGASLDPCAALQVAFDLADGEERELVFVLGAGNSADEALRSFVVSHPAVSRYCLNSENVGVSRAWNMGANLAKGDILCFLNDDVSVEKGGLEAMRNMLLSDEKIGQTGAGGCYWGDNGFGGMVEGRGPRDVDAVLGYCFMLRASLFHKLAGVDINYSPAGCEDIDLSYKVRQAGYRCVVDSDIPVKHHHHHGDGWWW